MDFFYINNNVLDNLFYILVSILIFFVLYDNVEKVKKYQKTFITTCTSIPMILCMKFPIYIDQYCIHDLRQIPFFIGILYGGWPVGAALLTILLTVRFSIYGFNLLTVVVYVVIFIITALLSKRFNTLNRKNKLIFSVLLVFFLSFISTAIALLMSDFFRVTEAYIFYFILLPPVIIFFMVYIIEILKDAIKIRKDLVKLEKMEVVSQLAASISHEVRNPLTVVKGFVELLKAPDITTDTKEVYIKHVLRELNNAESIISDYLAYARPATEKIEDIEVDKVIKGVLEVTRPLANMNSVEFVENLVPGSVCGNNRHFQQCFLNLIKNGIEAMPNGGVLHVSSFVDKSSITISLRDNGVGMTSEQINRFGEPYYSSKAKGTGLGSMVAVRTIQTMNGTIRIKSTVNEGTVIKISFPLTSTKN